MAVRRVAVAMIFAVAICWVFRMGICKEPGGGACGSAPRAGGQPSREDADLNGDGERLLRRCRWSEALQAFDVSLKERRSAENLAGRGLARFELGQSDGAVEDIDEALAMDPDCAAAMSHRAAVELRQREIREGTKWADRAIRAGPELPWAHLVKARSILFNSTGLREREFRAQVDMAESHFQRAVKSDPEFLPARMNLAELYWARGGLAAVKTALAGTGRLGDYKEALSDEQRRLLTDAIEQLDIVERWNKDLPTLYFLRASARLVLFAREPHACIPDCAAALKADSEGRPFLKDLVQYAYHLRVQQDPTLMSVVEEGLATLGPAGLPEFEKTCQEVQEVVSDGRERLQRVHRQFVAEGNTAADTIAKNLKAGERAISIGNTLCERVRRRLSAGQ